MEYREIVAVTGLGGLFQLMATKNDGAIVRNLADNTTRFISARLHNVTPLESIEIYTHGDNVRLHEVLEKMKESDLPKPDPKSAGNPEIRVYFKTVFTDLDEDRVYASDMKKMLKWYDLLEANALLDFSALKQAAGEAAGDDALMAEGDAQVSEHGKENEADVPLIEEGGEAAPEAAENNSGESEDETDKPAKKARAKKAAAEEDEESEKPAKKTAKKKKEDE